MISCCCTWQARSEPAVGQRRELLIKLERRRNGLLRTYSRPDWPHFATLEDDVSTLARPAPPEVPVLSPLILEVPASSVDPQEAAIEALLADTELMDETFELEIPDPWIACTKGTCARNNCRPYTFADHC